MSDSGGTVVEVCIGRSTAAEAVIAIVQHLPKLVALLVIDDGAAAAGSAAAGTYEASQWGQEQIGRRLETPYGLLTPPLGRMRLKVVELLAVLIRSSEPLAEVAMIQTPSLSLCMDLFRRWVGSRVARGRHGGEHHGNTTVVSARHRIQTTKLMMSIHCEILYAAVVRYAREVFLDARKVSNVRYRTSPT